MTDTYIKEEGVVISHCMENPSNLLDFLVRLGVVLNKNTNSTKSSVEAVGGGVEVKFIVNKN
jgi:hypothetical protein